MVVGGCLGGLLANLLRIRSLKLGRIGPVIWVFLLRQRRSSVELMLSFLSFSRLVDRMLLLMAIPFLFLLLRLAGLSQRFACNKPLTFIAIGSYSKTTKITAVSGSSPPGLMPSLFLRASYVMSFGPLLT